MAYRNVLSVYLVQNFNNLFCRLCRSQWKYATIYRRFGEPGFSFKALYLMMDEATLTFNADAELVR